MNTKQILIAILFVAILGLATAYYLKNGNIGSTMKQNKVPAVATNTATATMPTTTPLGLKEITKYVYANLETLSSIKPADGGKLSATKVTFAKGKGTVDFTDGARKYTADFTYTVSTATSGSEATFFKVSDFTVRK